LEFGRSNLCVTHYIHEQVMGALGGPAETRHARAMAFYRPALEALGDAPASEDGLVFWRNVVQAQVPAATSRVSTQSRSGPAIDDAATTKIKLQRQMAGLDG
jgi:hypothetical protein